MLASRGVSLSRARLVTTTSAGGMISEPVRYHSFGIAKVLVFSTPFICLGAFIAKKFASSLEDFDLFVPDDDDD